MTLDGFMGEHLYIVLFLATLIDATALPIPGRLLVITGGSLASAGSASLLAVTLAGAAGALFGDHLWFFIGKLGGKKMLSFFCKYTLGSDDCGEKAQQYFQRYGKLTVIIGRFIAGVRIFATPIAIAKGMSYFTFLLFDLFGTLLWSGAFAASGYLLGHRWIRWAEGFGGIKIFIVIFLAMIAAVFFLRMRRQSKLGIASPEPLV